VAGYAVALLVDPLVAGDWASDAKICAYMVGLWLGDVRGFSASATAGVNVLYYGSGTDPYPMPAFTPPALPGGTTLRPPGAANRVFLAVQVIKNSTGYTEAIGQDLRIIGSVATPPPAVPTFALVNLVGGACECIRIDFRKYGYMGVMIESKRGVGGAWENLGIDTKTPFLDERPLLAPTVPEVREYRLRFWHDGAAIGDWSPVQRVTVSPA